ncbi:hyaluronan mediated motility receptor [Rhinoderma darwinii]|uniref:hyaluronan mediated motility receptor n=1 Tax=Rhinoderma darwinii TaxID=43563 RepID=UPI003F674D7C
MFLSDWLLGPLLVGNCSVIGGMFSALFLKRRQETSAGICSIQWLVVESDPGPVPVCTKMSFPKAPLKRFNEHVGCAPAPGSYDVKVSDGLKGPVSFEKSQRFRAKKDLCPESQSVDREDEPTSPARLRKHSSLGSTPNLRQKPERDTEFLKEMKKQKTLEKEIRALLKERAEQDKKLQLLEEDFKKTELKLVSAVRERTSLTAGIASMERQISDLYKANELLKTKFSDDSSKRKITSLCAELMEAKHKVDAKDKEISGLQVNFEGKIQMLKASLAGSKADVQTLTERNKLLEEGQQEAVKQNDALEKERDLAQGLIEELKGEHKNLEEYLSNAHDKMQDLQLQMIAREQEYESKLQNAASQISAQSLALAKLEDIENKLLQAQTKLEEALQRVPQLEGQLAKAEEERSKLVQEKAETEKTLTATLEQMSDLLLQVENYKLLTDQAEENLKKKEVEQTSQRDHFSQKEEELLAKMRELEDKYIVQLQEKENLLIENHTGREILAMELEALKQQVSQGDGERQKREEEMKKLVEKEMETISTFKLEMQKVQEEMMKERSLLEDELEGALDELDRLQQQEEEAEKMILRLEHVNQERAKELARLEETLKGKNKALEKAKEKYQKRVSQLKEENSKILCKLSESESFQVSATSDIASLKSTNACLLEKFVSAEDEHKVLQQHLESKTTMIQELELQICKLEVESNQTKEILENQLLDLRESLNNTEQRLNGQKAELQEASKTEDGLKLQLHELQESSSKTREELKQLLELHESSSQVKEGLEQQIIDLKGSKDVLEQQFYELQETLSKTKDLLQQQLEVQDNSEKTKEILERQLYDLQETSERTKEGLEKKLFNLQQSSSKTVFELEMQVLEVQRESAKARNEMESKNKETMEEVHEMRIASKKIRKELEQQLHELRDSSKKTNEWLEKQVHDLQKTLSKTEHELDERNRELEGLQAQLQEAYTSKESESNEAILLEANKWRTMFEELQNKVRPFQQQLDAFEAEKNALLNEHGAAQDEMNKLSEAYAKLLGHQNQRQKIMHVIKLKTENTQLKQEVTKLRAQLSKEKQTEKQLQSHLNDQQGIKKFDPSKAFQHDVKENVYPKAPLREGNRNKC